MELITISMDGPGGVADALRYLLRVEVEGPGEYDAWSEFFLYQVGADYFDHPIAFPSNYLFADAEKTICAPGNGEAVLAAGAYCNQMEFISSKGEPVHGKAGEQEESTYPGRLYSTTQPGGLHNGWWKPIAVAPGIGVAAVVPLGLKPNPIVEKYPELAEHYVTLEGGLHGIGSGTSCAAPILTGAVALFLQKHPKATFEEIRRALAETSYADAETGVVPNSRAGYGKLDIYRLLCWPGGPDRQASSQ